MKKTITLIISGLIIFSCSVSSPKNESYQKGIADYQTELNKHYLNPNTTPLKGDEIAKFKGIQFFPIQEKYRVKANFTFLTNGEIVKFPTSAQKIQTYKEYGTIDFEIDNQPLTLTLYQFYPISKQSQHSLFLPFTDETSGDTSYGGGRYLDINITEINQENNTVFIDFNKAYNPYCAYSSHYSCPIPPANNFLPIEINAGVSYSMP